MFASRTTTTALSGARRSSSQLSSFSSKRSFSLTPTPSHIKRLTMFKIPEEKDIEAVLKEYEILREKAVKDGQKYIISNVARRVLNTTSPLSEGFTIASQSVFKNMEDHRFYDEECPAHKVLKKTTAKVITGKMTLVTEGEWPEPELR